jgi:hypothetical protein
MVNNYIPDGTLSILIGDGGITQATPSPTQVGGANVNTCLETQSTTRADIFMKPKTDAQIAAIVEPTPGMVAFSSDSDALVVRGESDWTPIIPATSPSILYAEATISNSELQAFGTSVYIIDVLPAPGAGLFYMVHGFGVVLTGGSTEISSPLGVALVYNGGPEGPFYQAALMPKDVFEMSSTFSRTDYTLANLFDGVDTSMLVLNDITNKPLSIQPSGPFSASGGSTKLRTYVWYSIIESDF